MKLRAQVAAVFCVLGAAGCAGEEGAVSTEPDTQTADTADGSDTKDSTTEDTASIDTATEDTTSVDTADTATDDTATADTATADTATDTATADTAKSDAEIDGGAGTPLVVINEVESSGGTPGDWVELLNAGTTAADLTGYKFKDNDDTHAFYVLPAGTTVAPGGYLVLEESAFGFGLGAADSARLFAPDGTTLVASAAWTAHAPTTYGRCAGSTMLVSTAAVTKGAVNACDAGDAGTDAATDGGAAPKLWPGADMTAIADGTSVFGGNLSGLYYQPGTTAASSVLWGARNNPSTLFRLVLTGTTWTPDAGWATGKTLRYPDGTGAPDAEDLVKADPASSMMYVVTERNNDASSVSRSAILLFDTSGSGASLVATREWNLTTDLPTVGGNLGAEAIAFLPDAALVARSFRDERLAKTYNPADYANHGGGLFMVGVEANGMLYVYALDHVTGSIQRVAAVSSGFPGVMSVAFDRDLGGLFAYCDDTCGNRLNVLDIDATGKFAVRAQYAKPSSLPNLNNEGITFAPDAHCVAGQRPFFWADDSETSGHSIRRDSIPCGKFW